MMKVRFKIVFLMGMSASLVWGVLAVTARAEAPGVDTPVEQNRKRLDDLFRWRVSDALGLDSKQETQFTTVLERIHDKRHRAGEEMARIAEQLTKASGKKEAEALITQYEKQTKIYSETQNEEIRELKRVFGPQKLGHYISLKNEMGKRLKSALSAAPLIKEKAPEKLPEPSIIEK